MKLTWTFFPKGEENSVTLSVVYVPELDGENLPNGGFLKRETNVAYVDWITYKRFDSADLEGRRDTFQRLIAISNGGEIWLPSGIIVQLPNAV